MSTGRAIHVAWLSAAAFVLAATFTSAAMTPRRTTYFTFNSPVRLTGVLLPAGTYVFEIANPDTASNVVHVLDRKRSKVYASALTRTGDTSACTQTRCPDRFRRDTTGKSSHDQCMVSSR